MLRQVHVLDTYAADLIFQKAYLANILINLRDFEHTFYKINLFLKYQNEEFKRF